MRTCYKTDNSTKKQQVSYVTVIVCIIASTQIPIERDRKVEMAQVTAMFGTKLSLLHTRL